MSVRVLTVEPLTRAAFAPFGDVIECSGPHFEVNDGTSTRFHDQASVDVARDDGRPCVSVFRAQRAGLPLTIRKLERHPLGSQAFVPMEPEPYLVVVALPGIPLEPKTMRAFAAFRQGVNYAAGVWHHPLISLTDDAQFLVLDRAGPGDNCIEQALDQPRVIEALP